MRIATYNVWNENNGVGSRFDQLIQEIANSSALNILFQAGEYRFSVTNVHLPWDSIRAKEQQIVSTNRYIREQEGASDHYGVMAEVGFGENG